jgi:glycosyltransferase involved in cell wall biosynthesis
MPRYHIAMTNAKDFDETERLAADGLGPRYAVPPMVRRLGATLYQADRDAPAPSLGDRLRSRLVGSPKSWSLARTLAARLGSDDVVYCLDADMGLPLAGAFRRAASRPKQAVFLHNLDRPRGRLAAKLVRAADTVNLFCSCCSSQLEFVQEWLKVSPDRTFLLREHLDNRFFTPGPPTPGKTRPVVASVGLERRDYVTLAAATRDLDIEVRVAAWSAFARKQSKTFPAEIPANMIIRSYQPKELVQLYRDANVVVVSMLPNKYAGITTLIEGLACRRPVVATRTRGLVDYLTPPGGISVVEPGDSAAMRAAIVRLLEHPEEALAQAQTGYESVERLYDFDRYIETIASRLESL